MTPLHAILSPGRSLPADYFAPGTSMMNGKIICSLWAIAFWRGESFRYERIALGENWVRVGERS